MAQDKSYIEMRELLKRVRNASKGVDYKAKPQINESHKNMSVREMKRRMQRSQFDYYKNDVNEDDNASEIMGGRQEMSQEDEQKEQEKLLNYLQNNNATVDFKDYETYEKGVHWGGVINGQIVFAYRVASDDQFSGVDVEYLEGFDPNDPENNEIIEKIKRYYNDFKTNWRDSQYYTKNEI